jgi:hypothetical protein
LYIFVIFSITFIFSLKKNKPNFKNK